jgi:hypothetical protein
MVPDVEIPDGRRMQILRLCTIDCNHTIPGRGGEFWKADRDIIRKFLTGQNMTQHDMQTTTFSFKTRVFPRRVIRQPRNEIPRVGNYREHICNGPVCRVKPSLGGVVRRS